MPQHLYPFAAVQGQDGLKEALLLNAVNPLAGGVLARGEKGTAKSTIARALSEILPPIRVFPGCPFNCDPEEGGSLCPFCQERAGRGEPELRPAPFRTLPLNATEDRICGGMDFSRAIKTGERVPDPGLLASVHRGVLYIDEVNLLDDHVVDLILDAAGSGRNIVEREGVSFRHPARFILVGTMNPEEGELRPQFLDRFGLSVQVTGAGDPETRVDLMLSREEFDRDPVSFRERFRAKTEALKKNILEARRLLPAVSVSGRTRKFIAGLCRDHFVAGHRADLFLMEAARAAAALAGSFEADEDTVLRISPLVLAHRTREAAPPPPPPPPEPGTEKGEGKDGGEGAEEKEADKPEEEKGPETPPPPPEERKNAETRDQGEPPDEGEKESQREGPDRSPEEDRVFTVGETFRPRRFESPKDRLKRRGSGRRSRSRAALKEGRYVKSAPDRGSGDIALDATIRAAAPHQIRREKPPGLVVALAESDFRERIREKKIGNHLFFLVDASGSMGARGRMTASKGAVMSLLLDAYQKRDQVALISFRRKEAYLNLPLTGSVDLAGKLLAELPVGGRTPLSAGLALLWRELRNLLLKNPSARPIALLITDGRANVPLDEGQGNLKPLDEALRLAAAMALEERVKYVVVDTEEPGVVAFNLAGRLALALEAECFKTGDLAAATLVDIVKESV
ncbi:MAG: ATP-binding protein [Deltaproteobacteria bacterium]|jgi:magnesium chelatase subunit D|nr:ATP-binding protein [Deltaproteobacteria bacterium]